jgi:hypothetical protein
MALVAEYTRTGSPRRGNMETSEPVKPVEAPRPARLATASLALGMVGVLALAVFIGGMLEFPHNIVVLTAFPLAGFSGLLAFILGSVARYRIKKSAGQLTGRGRAVTGVVLSYIVFLLIVVLICPYDDFKYYCFHCRSYRHAGTWADRVPYSWVTSSSYSKWYQHVFPAHTHNWVQICHSHGGGVSGVGGSSYFMNPMWIMTADAQEYFVRTATLEQLNEFDRLLDTDQFKAIEMILDQIKSHAMLPLR